ncbi:MAG: metallophosphoesterase [Saprospiraceae bacterium]|nr:metallophosphoesterase [Saprospiraceae bacterium]
MLRKSILMFVCVVAVSTAALSHDPPADISGASTDGPHVFYEGGGIIVRSIALQGEEYCVQAERHMDKSTVRLTCTVEETGDVFSFPLKKNLSPETTNTWSLPEKMLVISDVEGNFEAMKRMLLTGGAIDAEFNWIYGKGHVVMVGDFFDRGLSVTECLWLAYKLEAEAAEAGGKVHFILGNHEIMNLSGHTDYVRSKYFENARLMDKAYTELFNADTELGRWLRTKNAVERIGSYLFCHGGVSTELLNADLGIGEINQIVRENLGLKASEMQTYEAQLIFNARLGIFWYRGLVRKEVPKADVDRILQYYGARHMVVGHTLVSDIAVLYDGSIIAIDLLHEERIRTGKMSTLTIEKGDMYVLDHHGRKEPLDQSVLANAKK